MLYEVITKLALIRQLMSTSGQGDAKAHVRIGWLRSVCNIYHAFAVCSFADELAHEAGADPRDYLLRLAGPSRKVNLV